MCVRGTRRELENKCIECMCIVFLCNPLNFFTLQRYKIKNRNARKTIIFLLK